MYFKDINNIEDLHKEYLRLSKLHHPDFYSDEDEKEIQEEIMKEINQEYESISKNIQEEVHQNIEKKHKFEQFKKSLSPEQKEIGKKITENVVDFVSISIKNALNNKMWK